jgi:hypothetical protein
MCKFCCLLRGEGGGGGGGGAAQTQTHVYTHTRTDAHALLAHHFTCAHARKDKVNIMGLGDSKLSSYWDAGSCGMHGNDFQKNW